MKKHFSTRLFVSLLTTLLAALLLRSVSPVMPLASAATNRCGAWQDVPTPSNGQLIGIAAISHTDVWAVGVGQLYTARRPSLNSAIVEHWDGKSWSVINSPDPGGYNNYLNGVSALSSSDVWAVGSYEDVQGGYAKPQKSLIEHWDGTRWSMVPSPNAKAFFNDLWHVSALSPDDVWAVGMSQKLNTAHITTLIEHWDGTQWSIVPSPNVGAYINELLAVTALSASDVWAVGTYTVGKLGAGGTLIEHWNGKQWSVVKSPNVGQFGNELWSVAGVAPDDIWAVGEYAYSNGGGAQYATLTEHWNGSRWSVVISPNPPGGDNHLHGVTELASNNAWAVGGSLGGPIIIHWDGHQWSQVPTPGKDTRSLWSVSALNPHDVWAAGVIGGNMLTMRYC